MEDIASGSKRKGDLGLGTTEPEVFLYEGGELTEELGDKRDIARVRIGPQVEEIPFGTFQGCTNLTEVQFDEGALQVIGKSAFAGCTALRGVTIPSSVTELGTNAFYYCRNLTELHLNDGLRTIGDGAFNHCGQLRSVTIPSSATKLGAYLFWSCRNLDEVHLNEGLECIGVQAFYVCTALRCVTIPSTVTKLGRWAFDHCSYLSDVIFLGGQRLLNEEFLARRLSSEEGILKHEIVGLLTDDGSAFRGCPSRRVKISISWAVSERIARLPFECRLSVEEKIRNLPRLELMSDGNVVALFPLVRSYHVAEADDSDPEAEAEVMVDIQDTSNETARSVYDVLQLITFHELKESSILIELAMWKSRIDGDEARADCRVAIPGPAKSLIMEYCGYAGFLRPAIDGA